MDRSLWIYDLETLASCFTYTGLNRDTSEVVQYVIHKDRDDRNKLLDHLNICTGQIGFNNINFDYPIIHYFLTKGFYEYPTTEELIDNLYSVAQEVIAEQNSADFNSIVAITQKECKIPQLDLFKIWHFNNKARSTSLKALEVAMNLPNVMEMEVDHTRKDIRKEEIEGILEYNLNDVSATFEFYKRSLDKIGLRQDLQKKYKIPCLNFSDSKIGEQLMLKLYCNETKENYWDVKKLRTYRTQIDLGKCVFDYIKFNSNEFNKLLNNFQDRIITSTKGAIKESVVYKGFKYDFGTGGIHGCIKSGVYEEDSKYAIIDVDVSSLYPTIAVVNRLYPKHLGSTFCDLYADILNQRMKAKKEGNMVISDAFKLSLNSVYGKSNDQYSFLMDSLYTMKTTLNGQLMLAMLAEAITDGIEDLTVLQINTDGISVKINREETDVFYKICEKWEKDTKLNLEYVFYSKMVIGDVSY